MTEEKKDALERAVADLKQRGASAEPPQDVVNETLAQLAQAQHLMKAQPPTPGATGAKTLLLWSAMRLAAAAVVLVAAGYAFGRIGAPKPDVDELKAALMPSLTASLEPAIRESVAAEVRQEYSQAMVAGYTRLKDELTEQYRADMLMTAAHTLAASNTATGELVAQLVELVATTRLQDQEETAGLLEQIEARRAEEEARRAQERSMLANAIVDLASQTDAELRRTEAMVLRYLANTPNDSSIPYDNSSETMD